MPAFRVSHTLLFCWTGDCQDSEGKLDGVATQGLYRPGGRCAVALIVKFCYSCWLLYGSPIGIVTDRSSTLIDLLFTTHTEMLTTTGTLAEISRNHQMIFGE